MGGGGGITPPPPPHPTICVSFYSSPLYIFTSFTRNHSPFYVIFCLLFLWFSLSVCRSVSHTLSRYPPHARIRIVCSWNPPPPPPTTFTQDGFFCNIPRHTDLRLRMLYIAFISAAVWFVPFKIYFLLLFYGRSALYLSIYMTLPVWLHKRNSIKLVNFTRWIIFSNYYDVFSHSYWLTAPERGCIS